MSLSRSLTALAFALIHAAPVSAADWPQWRGPNRDGISEETGLLKTWPAGGPKLVWHAREIGSGYSTPSVVGDRIYVISNAGPDNEYVQALSTEDGSQVWSAKLGKVGPNQGPQYPGSRSTPTIDGDVLYALGSDGDLACVAISDGSVRWRKNLRSDFGGKPGAWAYSESALVDGDVLVCTPGGSEATLAALDKASGDVIWKSAVPGGDEAAYSSAIVVETGGVRQYVQFLGKGLIGVDAKSGNVLWQYRHTAEGSPANIPTPVAGGGLVYSATGRGGGGAVRLTAKGDSVTAEEVYFDRSLPSSIGGAVLWEGFLYGTTRQAVESVAWETGDIKWQDRAVGAASVCYADGRLYFHTENGDVVLVEANPEQYQEAGRFTPPNAPDRGNSKAWTYPVIADGRLYIRDQTSLWCYDVRGGT